MSTGATYLPPENAKGAVVAFPLTERLQRAGDKLFAEGAVGWTPDYLRQPAPVKEPINYSRTIFLPVTTSIEARETLVKDIRTVLNRLGCPLSFIDIRDDHLRIMVAGATYRNKLQPFMQQLTPMSAYTAPPERPLLGQQSLKRQELWKQALFRHGFDDWREEPDKHRYVYTGCMPYAHDPSMQCHMVHDLAALFQRLKCSVEIDNMGVIAVPAAAFEEKILAPGAAEKLQSNMAVLAVQNRRETRAEHNR